MPGSITPYGTMNRMTDRSSVREWLTGYEVAWRAPGTKGLADLFTEDATYLQSPYEQPVTGLDAIGRMWEREREGPGEIFTLATDIVAVDGQVAVVRAEVSYGDPPTQEYRDLWVIRFAAEGDGRCAWFEEWPFWPEQPHSQSADPLEPPGI
jgi:ketosteroid isomerase-like protein